MNNLEGKVLQFMSKHELYIGHFKPGLISHPPIRERLDRTRYMLEELQELVEAMQEEQEIEEVADALGDLLYVVIGTFICYGIPVKEVFDEVHKSNMTKSKLTLAGKGGKGPNFKPPNLRKVLEKWQQE